MGEFQVLSSEEVDAILKVTQDKGCDLSNPLGETQAAPESNPVDTQILANLTESIKSEFEKALSVFLRKKIHIKDNTFDLVKLSNCLSESTEKNVFSVFRITPNDHHGMFAIDFALLEQAINLLYGGQIEAKDAVMETPGKVGVIIAEKLCQVCLAGFTKAFQEYGVINGQVIKTSILPNLISNLTMDDQVYLSEMSIAFDEHETKIKFMVAENFIKESIAKKSERKHVEKDFWRTAIKSQVVDSSVLINVALPDVTMKVKDFMSLKAGDVIPIGDPTLVYICLNNLKLFRAKAGQVNSKRVAKILNQI